eukprot:4724645-Lingulodinium_polyedra.AAC.1
MASASPRSEGPAKPSPTRRALSCQWGTRAGCEHVCVPALDAQEHCVLHSATLTAFCTALW